MNLRDEIISKLFFGTKWQKGIDADAILALVEKHYNALPSGMVAVRKCDRCFGKGVHHGAIVCGTCNKGRIERDMSLQEVVEWAKEQAMLNAYNKAEARSRLSSGERVEVKK